MTTIADKFALLGTDDAPGQEVRSRAADDHGWMRGGPIPGPAVDFSHGNVDADAFEPTPGSLEVFIDGVRSGGRQAYTEYRGDAGIRAEVARRLADFTGRDIAADTELIITPGTQGALFLAIASCVGQGDQVAIVQPDYFANRKLVQFMGGEIVPVRMAHLEPGTGAGIDLGQLEDAFKAGAKTFLFSNPNNPAGTVYSRQEIDDIALLANRYGATVIVDQLYSRLLYAGSQYTHLRASEIDPDRVMTIMGPSKTESLSGYRLGVAFGSPAIVERMERLQAIVSLRAPGYSQAVLRTWFAEPAGWLAERIARHQAIRDDLVGIFSKVPGLRVRAPQAGSYVFPRLPRLAVPIRDFVRALRVQANVTVTPGTEFSPHAADSVRLNFSQNHADSVDAAERIVAMVDRYRG